MLDFVSNVKNNSMKRKILIGVVLHIKDYFATKIIFGGVAEKKELLQ